MAELSQVLAMSLQGGQPSAGLEQRIKDETADVSAALSIFIGHALYLKEPKFEKRVKRQLKKWTKNGNGKS